MSLQTLRSVAIYGLPLLCAGCSVLLGTYLLYPHHLPALARYHAALRRDLRTLFFPDRALTIMRVQALLAAGVVVVAVFFLPYVAVVTPVIIIGPSHFLRSKCKARAEALEAQLDGFLVALTSAMRAAPALGTALASVVPLCPRPIRDEFDWVVKAFRVGTPLDQALMQLADRVPSQSLSAAVNMLCIARRTGGDLANTLETSAASLREMARLEGVVRTKTASGKAQATAIGFLPIPLVAGLRVADENFLAPLLGNLTGHLIITASIVLWMVAIALANWIVAVDI